MELVAVKYGAGELLLCFKSRSLMNLDCDRASLGLRGVCDVYSSLSGHGNGGVEVRNLISDLEIISSGL